MHIPLRGNLIIQLTHGPAAEVPGIFIFGVRLWNLLIDTLKFPISDDCLSPEYQFSPERNP